jgi:hypothetical protein
MNPEMNNNISRKERIIILSNLFFLEKGKEKYIKVEK